MLKQLYLQNFRNYKQLEFTPDAEYLILSGHNGTGKSNLLESIYYLSTGYSFRQARDDNLVRFGSGHFIIRGIVSRAGIDYKIEVNYRQDQRRKTTKINDKRALPGDCSNHLPVVVFSPQDLILVKGSPAGRRRFLDLVVAQVRPQHNSDLHYYNSVLYQRNKQLRSLKVSSVDLLPWDQQLASLGSRIWKRRNLVLSELLSLSAGVFNSLSRGRILEGEYLSQIKGIKPKDDQSQYQNLFKESLKKSLSIDQRVKATTVGPHRDDFRLYLNGRETRIYASQGEQRLVALALKIGQYRLLTEVQSLEPILLLDDVFSELDEKHRLFVLEGMKQGSQVIATTTSSFKEGFAQIRRLTPEIFVVYPKNF